MFGLTFITPWMLAALGLLPALWWLMRVMPPEPKAVRFPAFFLLRDLQSEAKTAVRTPWWLLLLRAIILALFIIALAEPVARLLSPLPGGDRPVLFVVDNGWAAAANWEARQEKAVELMQPLARSGRSVLVLPTAPSADQNNPVLLGPVPAGEAIEAIRAMSPQSWPSDHAAAALEAEKARASAPGYVVFLSDGTARSALDAGNMLEVIKSFAGGIDIIGDASVNNPFLLRSDTDAKPGEMSFFVERLQEEKAEKLSLLAYDEAGAVLDELSFVFPAGERSFKVAWPMPDELRGKTARITLRGINMASAVLLTGAQWRQKPVGIIADQAQKDNQSFLNEVYYLRRALEADAQISVDSLERLIEKPRAVMIWPDTAPLTAVERVKLLEWVEAGGFLVRFAGPTLAANPDDPLLPVALRYGQRAMEGSMTWEKPVALGQIADTSPLFGLNIPTDVTVTRQVLATPGPETFERTWLQLEDGTPLVTGAPMGKGTIVLAHTTAGPDWSNYCYSGLYVETLKRMIQLSNGISGYKSNLTLTPQLVMDGFGRLQAPLPTALAGPMAQDQEFSPSPRTPPGVYGDKGQFRVFTLGDAISGIYPLPDAAGSSVSGYELRDEKNYQPPLLAAAVLLLLLDILITLFLRGVLSMPRTRTAVVVLMMVLSFTANPVLAADEIAVERASKLFLAYMETGDGATDQVSHNGLQGLAKTLKLRTTVKVEGVVGVNPETDKLFYYPFIYWPMTSMQRPLSLSAAREVQNYISRGGMIIFDTRDGQFGGVGGETIGLRKLRELTQNMQVPSLVKVGSGHILERSFYLLDTFPGLYAGGDVWVEKDPNPNFDAVTSIVIGGNDWAAAWSQDAGDRGRFVPTPGGEQQRERAYRVGINMVMMALAGNYKADQVHIPYILERIGR